MPIMDSSTAFACIHCNRDMSFFYADGELPDDDLVCAICEVQRQCTGLCGFEEDQVQTFNHRVVGRLLILCDMVEGLDQSVDIVGEILQVGVTPEVGMDVDLSEHHITGEVVGRLQATAEELSGVQRALVRTLPDVMQHFPREAEYVLNHHPAGPMVQVELARSMQ